MFMIESEKFDCSWLENPKHIPGNGVMGNIIYFVYNHNL